MKVYWAGAVCCILAVVAIWLLGFLAGLSVGRLL